MGYCKLRLDDTNGAVKFLAEANLIKHKNVKIMVKLAIAQLLNKQFKAAGETIQKSLLLERNAFSLFVQGVVFYQAGGFELALYNFDEAFAQDETLTDAIYYSTKIQLDIGKTDFAHYLCQKLESKIEP